MIIRVTADYPADEVRFLLHFAARQVRKKHAGLVVKVKNSRRSVLRAGYFSATPLGTDGSNFTHFGAVEIQTASGALRIELDWIEIAAR